LGYRSSVTGIDGSRSGILLVDKPGGMTSHDVVSRVRRAAGTRKVGHAGTLDPMATGLLVLGINSSTRLLTYLVGLDKEYLATIRLGAATNTDDAEGEVVAAAHPDAVDALIPMDFAMAVADLTGVIQQVPSSVSAIKVDGKRAYARARDGETVELPARTVTVSAFEILWSESVAEHTPDGPRQYWDVRVRVACSSGTYIRALARDLGAALGVGGHLTALRRTMVGPFEVTAAATLDDLDVASVLLAPSQVAATLFPLLALTSEQARDLEHGKRIHTPQLAADVDSSAGGPVAAIAPDGRLVGLIEPIGDQAKVLVNFPVDEPR
jgi:tRNA pseudouridine55 synthase